MLKKILIAVVVLIVAAGGGLFYLWTNHDYYIKQAVEKYGTAATQTSVKLDSVDIPLTTGRGSLKGLSVDNPKGFNDAVKAFYLGGITVIFDVTSLRGNGPIHIRQIDIVKPQVSYQITGDGTSNLSVIQENVGHYAEGVGSGQKSANAAAKPPEQGGERKVIIDNLYVRDGQIGITAQLLQQTKSFVAPLPEIHLANIGRETNGATMADVAQQVLGSMTADAGKAAAGAIAQNLGGLKDMLPLKGAAGDSLTNVGGQLKGLLGH